MFASAFRHPTFRRYFAGAFLASVGAEMLNLAVGWQIYEITHRALDLGIVGLVQFIPAVALTLAAGNAADSRDRTRIVVITTSIMMACAITLAICVPMQSIAVIYGVLLVIGCARTFESPAAQALVPGMVPVEDLPNALTWSSTSWQIATIVGPAIGGVVYIAGAAAVYITCAVIMAVAAALTFGLPAQRPDAAERASWERVREGWKFIRSQPVIFEALTLDLFAVILGGATALLPLFASDVLHVGTVGLGLLRSAPATGAAIVALLLANRPLDKGVGAKMLACVGVFGAATVVFGLSTNFVVSLIALLVLGGSDMVSVVVRATIVQIRTPDPMRGRVSAFNAICIAASNDLGGFESGLAAAWFGAMPAVVIGGVGTLIVVGIYSLGKLRRVDTLQ
ncbi:MAG: MFS transporter [Kofleriaceae bacterium]